MVQGQQPGESDREYFKRLNKAKKDQNQREMQERIEREAREERADRYADKDADDFLHDFLGTSLGDVRKAYSQGELDNIPDLGPAMKAINEANKKRWFDSASARNKRVEKASKKHRKALKKAGKQARKKKGWSW